jgi:hypothetical protein
MATTTDRKDMKTATAWYLTPDSKVIQKVQIPVDFNDYELVSPLLHCEWVENRGFTNHLGRCYGILMDEEGLQNPIQRPNNCARKLFRKIPLRWKTFSNYYIVYSYDCDEEGESTVLDMDITPKDFVDQYTASINRSMGL